MPHLNTRIMAVIICAATLLTIPSAFAGQAKTTSNVNIRTNPSTDAAIVKTLIIGATVEVEEDNGGWAKVSAGGSGGYVKSEFLNTIPAAVSYTTTSKVNLRADASTTSALIKTIASGVTVGVTSYNASGWSKATFDGKEGYIKSEFLTLVAQAPAAAATSNNTSSADANPADIVPVAEVAAVVYRTTSKVNLRSAGALDASIIKALSVGTSVDMIEYNAAAWSKVSANGTEGFVKSEHLVQSDAYKGPMSENGLELTPWSDAKNIFKLNTPATVYDVRSGVTYIVQSFSNGMHADVEPLTKDDTAIMHKTFGNNWSWTVRPVWVTINGHTMAASINGMPHGGGVISNNGMDGQICIHFLGSTVHNGNTSFQKVHQDGVMEAWNAR